MTDTPPVVVEVVMKGRNTKHAQEWLEANREKIVRSMTARDDLFEGKTGRLVVTIRWRGRGKDPKLLSAKLYREPPSGRKP